MKLESLKLKDFTRYQGEVSVDFAALGPGLVAIAGINGAGKTTLLEAPFGALHLEFPTRQGALYGVAHGKEASLDLAFTNGAPYRAIVAVDAVSQKTEAYLYNGDGSPITDGKIRNYTAEIERRFGSSRLFLSACLSAQNKRGAFLDLSKADRKDLLAEILDTGNLQAIAEAAREQAKAAEKRLENIRGQIAAHRAQLDALQFHEVDLGRMRAEEAEIRERLAKALKDVEAAREQYRHATAALAVAQEKEKQRFAKENELAALARTISDCRTRRNALGEELGRLKARIKASADAAKAEASRLPEYQEAAARVEELLKARPEAEAAILAAEKTYRELSDREASLRDVSNRAINLRFELERTEKAAGLLMDVPCKGEGPYSGCGFLKDATEAIDAAAKVREELPRVAMEEATIPAVRAKVAESRASLDEKRKALQAGMDQVAKLQAVAGKLQVAKAADVRIAELEREAIEGEGSIHQREHDLDKAAREAEAKVQAIQEELRATEATSADAAKAEVNRLAEFGRGLAAGADTLRHEAEEKAKAITAAEIQEKRARELQVHLDLAQATEADLVKDAGEWSTLERAFGRDGIQALEIDAAGPALSSLTNELLTSCFGPRFEVRFVTQVPKADGKGAKEVFDVQVIDHDRGREGSVDSLSGGEKTIVSEAISLALAIYVGKHSGHRFETLWRDETAGQLDPDNAARYIRMLRKAREVGSFNQIIYIAQQPEVYEAADAVLWCADGRVEVRA